MLLRMVWQGRLTGLLQESLEFAISPTAATDARKVAIRAVIATGSEHEHSMVRAAFSHEAPVLDREVLAALLETAPRSGDTSDWLCDCLERVAAYQMYSVDYLCHAICEFV